MWQCGQRLTEPFIGAYCSLINAKRTPNIANNEINGSVNRQFSVFYSQNFTRNNPQITIFLLL